MSIDVHDNPERSRYEAWADGEVVGFAQYRRGNGRIAIVHIEVDAAHEGTGVGSQLASVALDDARRRELAVLPACPFVAEYIRRHSDEYLDLVVPGMRAPVGEND